MRLASFLLLMSMAVMALAGCGGTEDSTGDLSRQTELAAARAEAAQDAHQAERIKQLERSVRGLRTEGSKDASSEALTPVATPADDEGQADAADKGDWPGGSAYSVMLGAFSSEANARSRQSEAIDRGLEAGVLYSSNFGSLTPGYWVVFTGQFNSLEDAELVVNRAHELGYDDAYPRFVSR